MGRRAPPPPRTLLPVPCSYGLMRQTHLALPSFGSSPRSESLCRWLPAPAANGLFPTLSLQIFPQMPGPLPRRSHRVLLPVSSPVSAAFPKTLWVGFPFRSANATFRGMVFEVADISLCSGLCVCVVSQIAPTAASFPTGQPRLLRPGISCFVTSARSGYAIRLIQVIDGGRTFTFPDLQPCRLLQCLSHLILFGERSLRKALIQFQEQYHEERNHQGKNNVLLFPAPAPLEPGRRGIRCRERLGGLLRYYGRAA